MNAREQSKSFFFDSRVLNELLHIFPYVFDAETLTHERHLERPDAVTKQLEKNPRDKRMSAMRYGGVVGRRHAFRET